MPGTFVKNSWHLFRLFWTNWKRDLAKRQQLARVCIAVDERKMPASG